MQPQVWIASTCMPLQASSKCFAYLNMMIARIHQAVPQYIQVMWSSCEYVQTSRIGIHLSAYSVITPSVVHYCPSALYIAILARIPLRGTSSYFIIHAAKWWRVVHVVPQGSMHHLYTGFRLTVPIIPSQVAISARGTTSTAQQRGAKQDGGEFRLVCSTKSCAHVQITRGPIDACLEISGTWSWELLYFVSETRDGINRSTDLPSRIEIVHPCSG
ncbi:hypothetical protein FB567DRAFT_207583 [Paraphoma chrysanthemicola]|uniref:Uncharacterized protein n=1 Tax=Paraphoma chrysanthemicola TaxID=798071 RepID=A0A8K0QW22_9PLEO|nr:hypothetical protein FB567DRAFT_207583 [Paraphoma chrysanthemicola]